MAGPSKIEATDLETLSYLQDPACGIPFDVHFEIEDEEGSSVGVVGGHKAVLALKSPVFKMDHLPKQATWSRSGEPQCFPSKRCCVTCMTTT